MKFNNRVLQWFAEIFQLFAIDEPPKPETDKRTESAKSSLNFAFISNKDQRKMPSDGKGDWEDVQR